MILTASVLLAAFTCTAVTGPVPQRDGDVSRCVASYSPRTYSWTGKSLTERSYHRFIRSYNQSAVSVESPLSSTFRDSPQSSSIFTTSSLTRSISTTVLPPLNTEDLLIATATDGPITAARTGQVGSVAADPVNPGAATTMETSATSTAITTYSREFTLNTATTAVQDRSTAALTSIILETTPAPTIVDASVTTTTLTPSSEISSSLLPLSGSSTAPFQTTNFTSTQPAQLTTTISSNALSSTSFPTQLSSLFSTPASIVSSTLLSPSNTPTSTTITPPSSTPVTQAASTSTESPQKSNVAVALGINAIFATLTTESPCNFTSDQETSACVDGQFAQCTENGRYRLSQCPQGQQCFALPLTSDLVGVMIQCDTASNADAQLGLVPSPVTSNAVSSILNSQTLLPSTTTSDIILPTPSSTDLLSTLIAASQSATTLSNIPSTSMSVQSSMTFVSLSSTQQPTSPTSTAILSEVLPSQTTVVTNPTVISFPLQTTSLLGGSAQFTSGPVPTATQVTPSSSITTRPSQISNSPAQGSILSIPASTIPQPIQTSSTSTAPPAPGFTIIPGNASGVFTVTVTETVTATVTDRH